jgi:L-threonylcarbamoyladenylate synthase
MKIIKIKNKKDKKFIEEIVKEIKKGGVVVLPTDTVYGLVGKAENNSVLKKIYQIKKRPFSKPLPLFVKDVPMAKKYVCLNKNQEVILQTFWPGKFTFVLKKKKNAFKGTLLGKQKTLGLRVSGFWLLKEIFKKINFPLAQTSANLSGQEPARDIREILSYFSKEEKISLLVDGGKLKLERPSLVIDLSQKSPRVLRN